MENNRFLLDSDYLEIITKEALEQIIQPGNEYKFIQAEELAEMSILENLVENYEIKPEYLKGLVFHYVSDIQQVVDLALLREKVDNPLF